MSLNPEIARTVRLYQSCWENGEVPDLRELVQSVSMHERTELLRELIPLDIQQQQRNQQVRQAADYQELGDAAVKIAQHYLETSQRDGVRDGGLAETIPMEGSTGDFGGDRKTRLRQAQTFGDYELLHEIARGGMGVVYKARQVRLNRIVALKMILSGELAGDQEVKRFHKEAEAAANLDHPGIVPIFEIGRNNDQHYFSMAYIDGPSLHGKLRDGPLSSRESARLCQRIAAAVDYAHSQGVIHRDLKPGNVLLDPRGEPKVTDFGLAKRVSDDSAMTRTGAVVGTPSYMPPEQATGQVHAVGPLSDVYSIGAILYCLLTGRPPFQAATVVETLRQVSESEPASPRVLNPGVDIDLETICLKCLEKAPENRIESAGELSAELNRYLQGDPIRSRRLGPVARAGRWLRRNRSTAAVVLLALFSVLVIAGAIGVGRRSAAARELVQLNSLFEATLERLELTPEYLRRIEELQVKIRQHEPAQEPILQQRVLDAWSLLTEQTIRRSYLRESTLEKITFALNSLHQQGADAEAVADLQALFEQRKTQWQPVFSLSSPFADVKKLLAHRKMQVRDGAIYLDAGKDAGTGSQAMGDDVVQVPIAAGTRAQLRAVFAEDWEASQELGLSLNHAAQGGYDFLLRSAPTLRTEHSSGSPDQLPQARQVTFGENRLQDGHVVLEIRRNGSPIHKRQRPVALLPPGNLRMWVKRDRDELSFQINDEEPIILRDPFPIITSNVEGFAIRLPSVVGVRSLRAEKILDAGVVTKLQQADALFEQAEFDQALAMYDQLSTEERERDVQQETRFKQGLCLLKLNRADEARRIFEPLFSEAGERWPPQAGLRLWLLRLQSEQREDADAIYKLLVTRFTFLQLAMMVPPEIRDDIVAAYTGTLTTIDRAIAFRSEQLERMRQAAEADRLLSYDGIGDLQLQFQLSRGYRYVEDYEAALEVLEPITRTTYFSTAWRHYLRVLRSLGRHPEALNACEELLAATHTIDQPNFHGLLSRIQIHLELDDWDAVEADLLWFLNNHDRESIDLGILSEWYLLAGFIHAQRGDQPGANNLWAQGYRQGLPLLAQSRGTDAAAVFVTIMGALSGELEDQSAWSYFSLLASGSEHPALQLAMQLVNQNTIGRVLKAGWNSARGREIARRLAYDQLTLRQRIEQPMILLASSYFAEFALGGQVAPEQEAVLWQAMDIALNQVVHERRLRGTQIVQIGLAWQGTSNFLGWGGVAAALDPELRVPLAYLLAHRYARLNKLSEAKQFLLTAIQDAPARSPVPALAQRELELMDSGLAMLRLRHDDLIGPEGKPPEVVVKQEGLILQSVMVKSQAELELPPGAYELSFAQKQPDFVLAQPQLTLAAGDVAEVKIRSSWRQGPDRGVLAGILPQPGSLDGIGRWQIVSKDPMSPLGRIARAPSKDLIASASARAGPVGGTVRIYDRDFQLLRLLPTNKLSVAAVQWSPDGDLLAVAGWTPRLDVWESTSGRIVASHVTSENISGTAWKPDGTTLVAVTNRRLLLLDRKLNLLKQRPHSYGTTYELAWSPDGQQVVCAADGKLVCWLPAQDDLVEVSEDVGERWRALAFSPQGRYFAAATLQQVTVWDWPLGQPIARYDQPSKYSASLAWSPEEHQLWLRSDDRLSQLDVSQPVPDELKSRWIPVRNGLTYDPDADEFVGYAWPNRLVRYRSDGETIRQSEPLSPPTMTAIAMESHHGQFVVCDDAKQLRIFDADGIVLHRVELDALVQSIRYSPDGKRLALADQEGLLQLLNPQDARIVKNWQAHAGAAKAISFSSDGGKLASVGEDGKARVWTNQGRLLAELPTDASQGHPLNWIAFNQDGTRLVAVGSQGPLLVWDQQYKLVRTIGIEGMISDLAWKPDGQGFALAIGGMLQTFTKDGEQAEQYDPQLDSVDACYWKDGDTITAVSSTGLVVDLDAEGNRLHRWQLYHRFLDHLAVAPHCQRLVAVPGPGLVQGWDLESRQPTFTTVMVGEQIFSFDAVGRCRDQSIDDISPLLYVVETDSGLEMLQHRQFMQHYRE